MVIKNRIARVQADYLFMILRPPEGWQPKAAQDIPPGGKVLSVDYVASFDEAHDDLLRCNVLYLRKKFEMWAIVQSAGGDL